MTTIAYNHKDREIAYDSRRSCGDDIFTDKANKKRVVNGNTYFTSGTVPDYDDFINDFEPRKKAIEGLDCQMFMVDCNNKVWWLTVHNGIYTRNLCECDDVIGSGFPWAMAAMDFGKNAKDAVEYAKTRDCKTGGKVKVFKIGEVVK